MCTCRMSTKLSQKRSRRERKSRDRSKTSSMETAPALSRTPSDTSGALRLTWKTCPQQRWPNVPGKPCRPHSFTRDRCATTAPVCQSEERERRGICSVLTAKNCISLPFGFAQGRDDKTVGISANGPCPRHTALLQFRSGPRLERTQLPYALRW